MSAGSGDETGSIERVHAVDRTVGFTSATAVDAAPLGSEQHEQKWQFGAHGPPDASVGQPSSHDVSPQIADNPLASNVSSAKNTIRRPRRTPLIVAWNQMCRSAAIALRPLPDEVETGFARGALQRRHVVSLSRFCAKALGQVEVLIEDRGHTFAASNLPDDLVASAGEIVAEEAAAIGLAFGKPAQLRLEAQVRAERPTKSASESLRTDEARESGAVPIELDLRMRQVGGADDRGARDVCARKQSAGPVGAL
jgi:hypothetical protein